MFNIGFVAVRENWLVTSARRDDALIAMVYLTAS